jgi:uncharacterized protein YuzE
VGAHLPSHPELAAHRDDILMVVRAPEVTTRNRCYRGRWRFYRFGVAPLAMMVHIGPYEFDDINYDAGSDVLYLSAGEPQPAADSVETPEGHIVRYDEHDRVISVTIVGARDLLGQDGLVSLTLARRSVTADPRELAAALAG